MSPLRKELDKHLKVMCEELGFVFSKGFYFKKEVNDFYSTIGFGHASFRMKGHIFLTIFVGVSNKQLYDIFTDNLGKKRSKYPNNIVQAGIGILKCNASLYEWDITEQTDFQELCEDIKQHIIKYAYPFYTKYSSIDTIETVALFEKLRIMHNSNIWLSIISYLKGDLERSLEYLNKIERKEGRYKYGSAVDERFDLNFRKVLLAEMTK